MRQPCTFSGVVREQHHWSTTSKHRQQKTMLKRPLWFLFYLNLGYSRAHCSCALALRREVSPAMVNTCASLLTNRRLNYWLVTYTLLRFRNELDNDDEEYKSLKLVHTAAKGEESGHQSSAGDLPVPQEPNHRSQEPHSSSVAASPLTCTAQVQHLDPCCALLTLHRTAA
jgi:hypothetical protein